jgi:hypothetical protein
MHVPTRRNCAALLYPARPPSPSLRGRGPTETHRRVNPRTLSTTQFGMLREKRMARGAGGDQGKRTRPSSADGLWLSLRSAAMQRSPLLGCIRQATEAVPPRSNDDGGNRTSVPTGTCMSPPITPLPLPSPPPLSRGASRSERATDGRMATGLGRREAAKKDSGQQRQPLRTPRRTHERERRKGGREGWRKRCAVRGGGGRVCPSGPHAVPLCLPAARWLDRRTVPTEPARTKQHSTRNRCAEATDGMRNACTAALFPSVVWPPPCTSSIGACVCLGGVGGHRAGSRGTRAESQAIGTHQERMGPG